jgi:hypothetical protein
MSIAFIDLHPAPTDLKRVVQEGLLQTTAAIAGVAAVRRRGIPVVRGDL